MISARIIADSLSPAGTRLTTWVLTYPRFIHAEIMTHREFSRNAASSRAIPIQKMIKAVWSNPAMPVHWGSNGRGMQASGVLSGLRLSLVKSIWLLGSKLACLLAWCMYKAGLHKQVANRVMEPWAHMTTIVSATEWGNFFNLRAHKDAQPEFQELAFQMLEAYVSNTPKELKVGEWHLPFSDKYLGEGLTEEELLKITSARCARVSYNTFEGDISHEKDYELHDRLLVGGHMSPFEHAAMALDTDYRIGNFVGFQQYRKMLKNENRVDFDPQQLLEARRK